MTRTPLMLVLALAAVSILASPVRAQTSAETRAAADALYEESGVLMKASHFNEACPKLETSQRLDPGVGTLLRLGYCYEHIGRSASAWSAYNDAEASARRASDNRADDAAARAKAIEPKLSRLLIALASPAPGQTVLRDGTPVDPGLWGTPVPVDPGEHVIESSAPGKRPWKASARIEAMAGTTTIAIPELLAGIEPPKEAPVAPPRDGASGSVQRPLGFALVGVGAAGLVIGAITLGLDASKHATFLQQCPTGVCPASLEPQLQGVVNSYHTLGIVSSTSLVAGGTLAATGLILALTAPTTKPQAAGISPLVGLGYAGLAGRF